MRSPSSRIARALSVVATVVGLSALTAGTTGCSMLSAITNPKAGFAMGEPAPMSLVVRRAEVARATSDEVDRLLTQTPLDDASKWTSKTALTAEQATTTLGEIALEPSYTATPGAKLRVLPVEAWLRALEPICPREKQHPSLVAALGAEVQKRIAAVAEQRKELSSWRAEIVKEDAAIGAKDATPADKDAHKKTKAELEEKASTAEKEIEPKLAELLATIATEAGKVDGSAKERLATPVLALERAVADAKNANSAAILRYPLALPTMPQEIQSAAKRILADLVEEKTGIRPDTNGLKPDVKLEGLEPVLTLNGIPADKLGGLHPTEMIGELTKRLKTYVERVTLLLPYAAETADALGFEGKVLEAMHRGLKLDPAKMKDAGDDLGELKIETSPTPAKTGDVKPSKGAKTPGGLVLHGCASPPAADKSGAASNANKPTSKTSAKQAQGGKPK